MYYFRLHAVHTYETMKKYIQENKMSNMKPIHTKEDIYRFLTNLGLKVQSLAESVFWPANKNVGQFLI